MTATGGNVRMSGHTYDWAKMTLKDVLSTANRLLEENALLRREIQRAVDCAPKRRDGSKQVGWAEILKDALLAEAERP
jgi:hypothetical protein